jgi:DNA-binding FadR family transcriptional regulator
MLPSDRVETDLRRRLQSGEWAPGAQLPRQRELAEEYGVSKRTVGIVIHRLAGDGLVTVIPSWGVFRAE